MKSKYLFGVALLAATTWGADTFHPLDVKTGLWETTMNSQMGSGLGIPPDLAARLTPEQRAKLEEAMKARAAQGSRTTVHRSCLTKDKLNQPLDFTKQQSACTHTVVTSNSSKQEVRFECNIGGTKESGTVRIEALNSETIKGMMQTGSAGSRAPDIAMDFTSKWLGSACSDKDEK